MIIRSYNEKDRNYIREICLETCTDERLLAKPDLLYLLYVDYYTDLQPNRIFVAADEKDVCRGYILCSLNPKEYITQYEAKYLPIIRQYYPEYVSVAKTEFFIERIFGREYPAHLHIDITESFQRKGVGGRLLRALETHLIQEGIKGLRLGCAENNEKGVNFYDTHGFKRLVTAKGGIIFGKKLTK